MRKGLFAAAIGLALVAPATAEVLNLPPETASGMSSSALPQRGTSMSSVESNFGEPSARRETVGGGAPRQPPITRWDYPAFSVIFEHDKVVHTVVHGAPPKIHEVEALTPSDEAGFLSEDEVEATPAAAPPSTLSEEMPLPESGGDVVEEMTDALAEDVADSPTDVDLAPEPEPEPEPMYEPEPEPVQKIPASSQIEKLPEAKFSTEDDPDDADDESVE